MPNEQTASTATARPKKCRVSVSLDGESLKLLDAWWEPLALARSRRRGIEALIGIALGDARWGKNSPGFGAAWTPSPGFESIADNRPNANMANESAAEAGPMLPSRRTSTGQVLRLVPSISVRR